MIGYEEKAMIVLTLANAADALGRAITAMDNVCRRDIETVRSEPEAADKIVIEGPEVIKALQSMIRRYQR